MVFSSIMFLGVFLPVFLAAYFLSPNLRIKNFCLVFFSLVFYAWGEPVWVIALFVTGFADYINGMIITRYGKSWQSKTAVVFSLVLNLGLLAAFKYSGFIVENINSLFGLSLDAPGFKLPLGISFYTFQTISYTIDVYRGNVKAQRSFINFMSYLAMFPQLVAGPIIRYADIEKQLSRRRFSFQQFSDGISRFVIGLGKKVMLANSAGSIVKFLFEDSYGSLSMMSAWLGILMFSFQIYFDFSGYSDMAIGLGKMIGYDFKENFNYPYISRSITDFWRRWHISLSSFFKDYVYIPLGGNRHHYIRNIAVVWFLTGLWHGASWNFILWGVYFGAIILAEKYLFANFLRRLPGLACHAYALALIVIGWVFFYFTDLGRIGEFFGAAFNFSNFVDFTFSSTATKNCFLLVALVIGSTPLPAKLGSLLSKKYKAVGALQPLFNVIVTAVCFLMLLGDTFNPFLYFRF